MGRVEDWLEIIERLNWFMDFTAQLSFVYKDFSVLKNGEEAYCPKPLLSVQTPSYYDELMRKHGVAGEENSTVLFKKYEEEQSLAVESLFKEHFYKEAFLKNDIPQIAFGELTRYARELFPKGEAREAMSLKSTGEDIRLTGEKKRHLMNLYNETPRDKPREIKVSITRQESTPLEYDGEIISNLVGQKLYEIMQKSVEGLYM